MNRFLIFFICSFVLHLAVGALLVSRTILKGGDSTSPEGPDYIEITTPSQEGEKQNSSALPEIQDPSPSSDLSEPMPEVSPPPKPALGASSLDLKPEKLPKKTPKSSPVVRKKPLAPPPPLKPAPSLPSSQQAQTKQAFPPLPKKKVPKTASKPRVKSPVVSNTPASVLEKKVLPPKKQPVSSASSGLKNVVPAEGALKSPSAAVVKSVALKEEELTEEQKQPLSQKDVSAAPSSVLPVNPVPPAEEEKPSSENQKAGVASSPVVEELVDEDDMWEEEVVSESKTEGSASSVAEEKQRVSLASEDLSPPAPVEEKTAEKSQQEVPSKKASDNDLAASQASAVAPVIKPASSVAGALPSAALAKGDSSSSGGASGETKNESSSAIPEFQPGKARGYKQLVQKSGNPLPVYPQQALEKKWEGRVDVIYYVNTSGLVEKIQLHHSSGHSVLDNSALQALARYRYNPGQEGWVSHPVDFVLDKNTQIKLTTPLRTQKNK